MSSLHNIKYYKLAKDITKEFPELLQIIDESIKRLDKFKHYKEANKAIYDLRSRKIELYTQLRNSELVINRKACTGVKSE